MAKFYRNDLLYAVNSLARYLTKSNTACDKKLHCLICYTHGTRDMSLRSFVGDPFDKCHLAVFSDAAFAGDTRESKSTSGCFAALIGPSTFAPISALCKTQSCVSHSSAELEIIALDHAMRNEGIPLLTFLHFLASGGNKDGARGRLLHTHGSPWPHGCRLKGARWDSCTRSESRRHCLVRERISPDGPHRRVRADRSKAREKEEEAG